MSESIRGIDLVVVKNNWEQKEFQQQKLKKIWRKVNNQEKINYLFVIFLTIKNIFSKIFSSLN